jgi:hypothetical protein
MYPGSEKGTYAVDDMLRACGLHCESAATSCYEVAGCGGGESGEALYRGLPGSTNRRVFA